MTEFKLTTNTADFERCAALMSNSEPFSTLQLTYAKCLAAMQGGDREVYIVQYNSEFAGFAILQLAGLLRGYIQTLCLVPHFQGAGIGTALIRFCIARIQKMSPNVFICVSSFNHRAQKLYYSLGFEKIGEFKDHIVRGHDEYLLRISTGPHAEFVPSN